MENTPALQLPATPKKRVRWQFFLAALLALAFLVYFFQPGISTWWLRRQLTARALDYDCSLTFRKIEADFFTGHALLEGMELIDTVHSTNRIRTAEIQVEFSPWRLLFRPELSPIKEIVLGKTVADWKWQNHPAAPSKEAAAMKFHNHFPEAFTGNGITANLECGKAKIAVANADFTFLPNAAGEIDIPHFSAALGPWKRIFNNLEGVTAIKGRALYVGGLKFASDLVLERGALDFTQPNKQKITSDLLFSAFGGQWRTDLDLDRRKHPLEIDAAASFWNLSVKQLGEFVGNGDLAEGLIHEGRFTFRGSPAEPTRSNSTLRLNATDFRWHERRWNSLIASALLVNRRIEIPLFDLVQDKNQIQIKGISDLPTQWSQLPAEFQLNVLAQIDDLHSAALLILPGQKGIAGEAFFAGEVRNQKGQFSGNLKMRGGPLQIAGVAVDRVRGDLHLQGSEVSATALEFVRRDDKASGWATLELAEPRRYSGQFEVQAGNIGDYAAILPQAVGDHAVAGGVTLWWSGDGTRSAHSGAFQATLRDFLLSHDPDAVPLDVQTHGSYSPAGITLNHLSLKRPNTKLDAAVIVRPDSMELRDLRLTGSGGANISGNITLPINLLSALNTPTLASLLDSKASAIGQITASKVRLDEISELAGRRQPIRGRASFDLQVSGPLETLNAKLHLGVEDFFGPGNLAIPSLKADLSLVENTWTIQSDLNLDEVRDTLSVQLTGKTALSQANLAQGRWLDMSAPISGQLAAKRFAVTLLQPWWGDARAFQGDIGATLAVSGSIDAPVFEGKIDLLNTDWQPTWLGYPLQKLNGTLNLSQHQVTIEKLLGKYRGGTFNASGRAGFQPSDDLDLEIEGKSITLAAPDTSEAVVNGSIHLQGVAGQRTLQGAIQLQSAVLHRELRIVAPEVELPVINRFSLPWVPPEWKLNMEITAAAPIEIRGKDNTWMALPEWIVTDMARTPILMGKLSLRPLALTKNVEDDSTETRVYFQEVTLENGIVEDGQTAIDSDLPPAPTLDSAATATPDPTPAPIPRHLEILPLQAE